MPYIISPILKVTEMCNFDCSFCRYSNHEQKTGTLSIDLAKKILSESAEINGKSSKKVQVYFHGGEPLLWGIDNFQKIFKYEKELCDKYNVKFSNSIQTNASLINDEWIKLILSNHINIGVSLDGPMGTNAHFSHNEEYSFLKTISILKKLKNAGIPVGILSVITNKHIKDGAKKFYNFLISNEIYDCGLCYCYNPDDDCYVDPEKLGYYLIDLFDLYFNGKNRINIREFNEAITTILSGKTRCCNHRYRERCGYCLTFLPSGDAFFCDPYNLRKENCLGNVSNNGILELITSENHRKLTEDIRVQVDEYCKGCSVNHICKYGCPRTDVDNKENFFCPTNKIVYSHISEVVKNFKEV